MPALALANTVQNSLHPIILLVLLRIVMGSIRIRETIPTVLKILVAATAMGLVAWGVQVLLGHIALFSLNNLSGQLLTVIVAGGLAVLVYGGAVLLLKVEEVGLVAGARNEWHRARSLLSIETVLQRRAYFGGPARARNGRVQRRTVSRGFSTGHGRARGLDRGCPK